MKKVTMKMIAEIANVSVATVSYILNNVKNQKIPDETKSKVLQIAKDLNYVPNLAARSLVMQKTGLVGILINKEENQGFWKSFQQAEFIRCLEELLTSNGYHVLLFTLDAANPSPQIIQERKLDGVFLIDVNEKTFYDISRQFQLVPLVVIDSVIDDPLFFKVMYDFESAVKAARKRLGAEECYLIMESRVNEGTMNSIINAAELPAENLLILKNEEELAPFLEQHKGGKGIILNEFIALLAAKHSDPEELTVICTSGCPEILPTSTEKIIFNHTKPTAAFEIMEKMLSNEEVSHLDKYIKIKPVNSESV